MGKKFAISDDYFSDSRQDVYIRVLARDEDTVSFNLLIGHTVFKSLSRTVDFDGDGNEIILSAAGFCFKAVNQI